MLVFWILPVIADTPVSGLVGGQPLLGKRSETSGAAIPPNPANLPADWWRYFEVEAAVLKERVEIATRQLNAILQDLPEDERSDAKGRIDHIIKNMRVLLDLQKKA